MSISISERDSAYRVKVCRQHPVDGMICLDRYVPFLPDVTESYAQAVAVESELTAQFGDLFIGYEHYLEPWFARRNRDNTVAPVAGMSYSVPKYAAQAPVRWYPSKRGIRFESRKPFMRINTANDPTMYENRSFGFESEFNEAYEWGVDILIERYGWYGWRDRIMEFRPDYGDVCDYLLEQSDGLGLDFSNLEQVSVLEHQND